MGVQTHLLYFWGEQKPNTLKLVINIQKINSFLHYFDLLAKKIHQDE